MPGPVGKRSETRVGHPHRSVEADEARMDRPQLDVGEHEVGSLEWMIAQPIVIPEPVTGLEHADVEDGEQQKGAWHPIARELWDAICRSGQAIYYEPTDWMVAKLLCESISRDLKPQVVGIIQASDMGPGEVVRERIPLKGASLGAYMKTMGSLLMLEGDRRRLQIELQRERSRVELDKLVGGNVTSIRKSRKEALA